MILLLPTDDTATIDAFAQALDALTPGLTVSSSGRRHAVLDALTDDQRTAIRALADTYGATIEGDSPPKALTHGCRSATAADLLAWTGSISASYPRLHKLDTVGRKGLLKREAWYRVGDIDFGLTTSPKAGRTPVYAIDYPSWTWGTLPGTAATKGITERGPRTQTWYAEDGSIARTLTDDAPKLYAFDEALSDGARRRSNVVGTSDNAAKSRVASIATMALLSTYPTEDPGTRAGALLAAIDPQLRAYRSAGLDVLYRALTPGADGSDQRVAYDALLAAHPWLLALVAGIPCITLLADEVEDPADGLIVP